MTVEVVKIRATVSACGLTVSTPFIQSFNVNRNRGSISTCSASLKVSQYNMGFSTGGPIIITAMSRTIFTGIVKKIKMRPCFDDPSYVFIDIEGQDVLSKLVGKKYTRRSTSHLSGYATIDSVVRPKARSGKFKYSKRGEYFGMTDGDISNLSNEIGVRQSMPSVTDNINASGNPVPDPEPVIFAVTPVNQ